MGADEAPEIDDNGANVGRLAAGHPDDVPMALRFPHRVKQVHVLLREHLGCGGFGTLPRKDSDVGDVDGGDSVEGQALALVVGVVQPAVPWISRSTSASGMERGRLSGIWRK